MEDITLDKILEILEITDLDSVTLEDIPKIKKRASIKWHPDKIEKLDNAELTRKYTQNFQSIEPCIELLTRYVKGEYHVEEKVDKSAWESPKDPGEYLREKASMMQDKLREIWEEVVATGFKLEMKDIIITQGIKVREYLKHELENQIPAQCLTSIMMSMYIMIPISLIGFFFPVIISIASFFWVLQIISCFLAIIPLSAAWMPEDIYKVVWWFVNIGLGFYETASHQARNNARHSLLFDIPVWIAKIIQGIVFYPLYLIAGEIWGDKVLGRNTKTVCYYGGVADWYIQELMERDPKTLTDEEILDLSHAYIELRDIENK